jgi:uncharacterized protein
VRTSLLRPPVPIAILLIAAGVLYLGLAIDWRRASLLLVGAGAGLVLYHSAFGFTSAWRALIADRRGGALRAQMLMLAVTSAIFLPLLADGQVFGRLVRGTVAPVGVSVLVGAFVFGIGMQLGGGCASGTLYTAGGGSVRMLVTLAAFIAGSVIGVLHMPMWEAAPSFAPTTLLNSLGLAPAMAASLGLFGMVAMASVVVERRRHGALETRRAAASILHGPWPLVAGAIGLAVINVATLLLAGRPWGVTSAFALWGSKIAALAGADVGSWPYWQTAARAAEFHGSVFEDVTSVMDFGIVLGALAAAGLAGRFAPSWRMPLRSLVAAIAGGLMLGYGARIAYGCNIGAYFGGIASSSVHGWVWFASAFAGNMLGTRLRPWFGLRV